MENLNIRITAQSQDAESAIDEVNQNLGELSATAEIADNQVDELNDELRETGAAGAVGATGLNAVALSSRRASAGIALFHAASLPLVATVGALTAGLLGLATVFGALGLAAVAVGASELKAEFAGIKGELIAAVEPLAEDFLPLLKAAINALPELTRNLVDAIGDTSAFRESLAAFGRGLMRVLPDLVQGVTGFARALLPFLNAAGPALVVLAEGFAVTGEAAEKFGEILDAIPYSGIALGITGIWLALAPITGTITTILGVLGLLAMAWESDFLGMRSAVMAVLGPVQDLLNALNEIAGMAAEAIVKIRMKLLDPLTGPAGPTERALGDALTAPVDIAQDVVGASSGGVVESSGLAEIHKGEAIVNQKMMESGMAGGGVTVNIGSINASGRQEGQQAGRALSNSLNRELRGQANLPGAQRGG